MKSLRIKTKMRFQSTLPYGSDLVKMRFKPRDCLFQSTLPYGSDAFCLADQWPAKVISIHAPLRERRSLAFSRLTLAYFNPRSLTGATHNPPLCCYLLPLFQSTLPYGSDLIGSFGTNGLEIFQSTLPYGSDTVIFTGTKHINNFNPRSLTGATGRTQLRLNQQSNFNPRSLTGAT